MNNRYELTTKESRSVIKNAKALYNSKAIDTREKALAYALDTYGQGAKTSVFVAYIGYMIDLDAAQTVTYYLQQYARFKKWAYECLNDKGALADLFEVLIRIASKRNYNLVHISDLHVKTANTHDIILNGVPYEIGSNGKTWTQATMTDYMNGDFNGVIYGMYDKETMYDVISCINRGEIKNAVNTIASNCVIFENKYDFLNAIQTLTRGAGITYKATLGIVQSVYNDSKLRAFINAIGTEKFICYSDVYHI